MTEALLNLAEGVLYVIGMIGLLVSSISLILKRKKTAKQVMMDTISILLVGIILLRIAAFVLSTV